MLARNRATVTRLSRAVGERRAWRWRGPPEPKKKGRPKDGAVTANWAARGARRVARRPPPAAGRPVAFPRDRAAHDALVVLHRAEDGTARTMVRGPWFADSGSRTAAARQAPQKERDLSSTYVRIRLFLPYETRSSRLHTREGIVPSSVSSSVSSPSLRTSGYRPFLISSSRVRTSSVLRVSSSRVRGHPSSVPRLVLTRRASPRRHQHHAARPRHAPGAACGR